MQSIKFNFKFILFFSFMVMILIFGNIDKNIVEAHGGKNHGGISFTSFQALQKATELFDRLIANGKLDETWETSLTSIDINTRGEKETIETRVGFHRNSGSPESVYIFFSADGNYSGSNFDGKW
jgi:hypothetical protein